MTPAKAKAAPKRPRPQPKRARTWTRKKAYRSPQSTGVSSRAPTASSIPTTASPRPTSSPTTPPSPRRCCTYVADRPLSLVRAPAGVKGHQFFQKHDTGGFPAGFKKVVILHTDADDDKYLYIDDAVRPHRRRPDERARVAHLGLAPRHGRKARAHHLRHRPRRGPRLRAREAGREGHARHPRRARPRSFPMATGGKGIHVIARSAAAWNGPRSRPSAAASPKTLEKHEPDRFVAELSKAKRKGRMFVDYLRNERGSDRGRPLLHARPRGLPGGDADLMGRAREARSRQRLHAGDAPPSARQDKNRLAGYFDVKQPITQAMLKQPMHDRGRCSKAR